VRLSILQLNARPLLRPNVAEKSAPFITPFSPRHVSSSVVPFRNFVVTGHPPQQHYGPGDDGLAENRIALTVLE
jgi:hypothetical protein